MFYCDTSALAKLVMNEEGTGRLQDALGHGAVLVSSELVRTELRRAVNRYESNLVAATQRVLDGLVLVTVTADVLDDAAMILPPSLRSLDAIHLASALVLREELEAVISYDRRMLTAASALGLPVLSPGQALEI